MLYYTEASFPEPLYKDSLLPQKAPLILYNHHQILQKIFQKLCPLFGKAKSRLYYPAKRGGTTAFRQKGGEHHDT